MSFPPEHMQLRFVSRFNDYFVLWLAVVTLVSVARPAMLGQHGCRSDF